MNSKKHSTLPWCSLEPRAGHDKSWKPLTHDLNQRVLLYYMGCLEATSENKRKDLCCIWFSVAKKYSWQKAGRFPIWCSTSHLIRAHAQTKHISLFQTHLKALWAHFLALLHPGDSWFGLPDRLAYEGRHPSWNPCLIFRSLNETGHACERKREKH